MPLIEELKNYLDITWRDEATDKKISGIMKRAGKILSEYSGEALTFEDEQEKQLLFDCCRYIYNNSLEDFKNNFAAEILMLRAKHAVKEMEDENAEVSEIQ